MAVLDSSIYNGVVELGKKAVAALQIDDLNNFEQYAEQGWNLFPEPKTNWNQGYNYAKMAFKGFIQNHRFESAKRWLNRMIEINNNLQLFNAEVWFYVGKYYFETGEYENAHKEWEAVVKDAGLRYFDGEDKKYLDFYKHPEKYMK
jgi:tetratricopeptide (TPR) repeat protein